MLFFLDTADVDLIKRYVKTGLVDGVTTNPSLIAAAKRDFFETLKEIADVVDGPISAEVVATKAEEMVKEGQKLSKISSNIVVKIPMTFEGLEACRMLKAEGIETNVTLCFSSAQALLAAKAGATFVSPFIGRLDDAGYEGMGLIEEVLSIYNNYPDLETLVLTASIRHPLHVVQAAQAGSDAATIPPKVFEQLIHHPFTEKGLQSFESDWKKTGQSIL